VVGYLADNPAVYLESYLVPRVTRWVTRCATGGLSGWLSCGIPDELPGVLSGGEPGEL